ncbi:helix-turn-helix domain-containing protein [Paraurantiacibacter namhicola]|uniref:Cytoskeletal protein RodZ n=1 Tax=Paraurantiacibacter namhicola TaxID=645517 RepID=A0A1C7DBA7_9SPHN|nr:helix-turn-helix domain-containing protein [Paraurantiacibacter namhicola]ANU08735.1 cytoskeletal protein RodZ [Paraurantiacibacter namhicola]
MSDETSEEFAGDAPVGVGAQLAAAREAKGLSVEQVAAQTRIPIRHLETIEAGRFSDMPGKTYATGFARTYAKLVDLDQDDVTAMVRAELDEDEREVSDRRAATFEPGDPSRAPSRGLVWFSLFALVLVVVGLIFAARAFFTPAGELPSILEPEAEQTASPEAAASPTASAPTSGPVVFTAQGDAWVSVKDGNGQTLYESLMTDGDSFTVPADAVDPVLVTGRPDILAITIGGQSVPKISEELETVVDVPVSAAALLARGDAAPAAAPGTAPTSAPAAGAPAGQ